MSEPTPSDPHRNDQTPATQHAASGATNTAIDPDHRPVIDLLANFFRGQTPGGATASAPPTPAVAPAPPAPPGYVLLEEVGAGGMGVVYRAREIAFGRDVAVKVLRDRYPVDSPAAERFVEEARITGQLQHPGVPPVHHVGTLPDGRPFLAMKLIKGDTLDRLLKRRPGARAGDPPAGSPEPPRGRAGEPPAGSPEPPPVSHDRGRFVAAFEQVCQALAYAHACNVIHRDLKPQNVMVGSFGEVQVMDWGLAKVLGADGPAASDPAPDPVASAASPAAAEATDVRTLRDGENPLTRAGSALGTPAYMPPEQAAGAVDLIDFRSDVFGLGGILVAILTGRPPFVGETADTTRQLAAGGKVQACFARLDACGADPELVALCKRCLAPDRDDRPADAGVVARAVAEHLAGIQERAEQERLDRVRAAERRRRRLWVASVVVLAAAITGAVLAAPYAREWYEGRQLRRWAEWADAHQAHTSRMTDGKYMVRFNRRAGDDAEAALHQAVAAVIDRAEKDGLTGRIGGIDLSGHGLVRVPPEVYCCRGLTTLYLNGNALRDLPPDIGGFPELATLDLAQNQLEVLPSEIAGLARLASLELAENRFRAIPPQVFRLRALTYLSLKRNEQITDPDLSPEIGQLTELTVLDLSRTNLKRLPPGIGRLGKLTKLHIPRNDLAELPAEVGDLRNLKALHLSNNKNLTRLPPGIGKLSQLAELYASDCGLTELPAEVGGLANLTTVHLSGNQLTAVPPGVAALPKLRTLDLRLNPLRELPAGIAEALRNRGTTVQLGEQEKKGGGKHRP